MISPFPPPPCPIEWVGRVGARRLNKSSRSAFNTLIGKKPSLVSRHAGFFFYRCRRCAIGYFAGWAKSECGERPLYRAQRLTDTKQIRPAHYLISPSIDGKTRWKEFSCHRPFLASRDRPFMPMAQAPTRSIKLFYFLVISGGQSLGGWAALYSGVTFPILFKSH